MNLEILLLTTKSSLSYPCLLATHPSGGTTYKPHVNLPNF